MNLRGRNTILISDVNSWTQKAENKTSGMRDTIGSATNTLNEFNSADKYGDAFGLDSAAMAEGIKSRLKKPEKTAQSESDKPTLATEESEAPKAIAAEGGERKELTDEGGEKKELTDESGKKKDLTDECRENDTLTDDVDGGKFQKSSENSDNITNNVISKDIDTKDDTKVNKNINNQTDIKSKNKDNKSKNKDKNSEENKKFYINSRPSYAKGQVEAVWKRFKISDNEAKAYDGTIVYWDRSKSRADQWVMGHLQEQLYCEKHKEYMNDIISVEDFLEWYHEPKNYRVEAPKKKYNNYSNSNKPYAKSRPKFAPGQVEAVWNEAPKQPDGGVKDVADRIVYWDRSKPRTKQWHMGHKPQYKYEKHHNNYMNGLLTTEQFVEWYQTTDHYRVEAPETNWSQKFEDIE